MRVLLPFSIFYLINLFKFIVFVDKNNRFYVQAGAGVVADSNPHNEYVETVNKAKALMKAVD